MLEKTKKIFQQQLEQGVFPCIDWAYLHDGKVEKQYKGNAQVYPTIEPLQENQLFDLASLTKVVATTTVVLLLMEKGRLNIDVPFSTYYPEFEDGKVTIRHLLTHTSDINPWIENRDRLNAEELRSAFSHLKSGENIGKTVKYTDTGTVLLGFMLEEMFGKDVTTIFQEEVLTPLGMFDTFFSPVDKRKAVPTENHPIRGLIRGETHDPKAFVLGSHAGSAGMFSTVDDLTRFVEKAFFTSTLLQTSTIHSLYKDWTKGANQERSLGWDIRRDTKGNPYLFHTGFTGTFLLIDVFSKRAVIVLTNRVHPENHRESYIEEREKSVQVILDELLY